MKNLENNDMSNHAHILNLTNWNMDSSDDMKETVQESAARGISPYCFQCGKVAVEVKYADNGPELSRLIKDILLREKAK